MAANEGHHIASMDITGAFLQGEKLDREVFVKPPPDIIKEKPGIIWKLNKCLYGLNDASRNFYYRVRPLLREKWFQDCRRRRSLFLQECWRCTYWTGSYSRG